LLTSRRIAQLPHPLAAHYVPASMRPAVEHAVASGSQVGPATPRNITAAVADAFTSGIHAGLAAIAVVFLVTSFIAAFVVRNRPHTAVDPTR
jgi:DHA2 family methylenomycin A resistance protein-like MFS transporter/DHA2 family multidrug resistance protein-like MFS transporter